MALLWVVCFDLYMYSYNTVSNFGFCKHKLQLKQSQTVMYSTQDTLSDEHSEIRIFWHIRIFWAEVGNVPWQSNSVLRCHYYQLLRAITIRSDNGPHMDKAISFSSNSRSSTLGLKKSHRGGRSHGEEANPVREHICDISYCVVLKE